MQGYIGVHSLPSFQCATLHGTRHKKVTKKAPKKIESLHLMDHPRYVGVLFKHKNTKKNTKKHSTSCTPRPRNI